MKTLYEASPTFMKERKMEIVRIRLALQRIQYSPSANKLSQQLYATGFHFSLWQTVKGQFPHNG